MSDPPPHSTTPDDGPDRADSASLADITERLFREFDGQLNLTTIVRVVRRCRRELDTTHGGMLPEMLERLARQRLAGLVSDNTPADEAT